MKKAKGGASRARNYELPFSKPTEELLDLSRRALKELPSDKKYEQYRRLSLDHNRLQTLVHIQQFQRLQQLSLVSNKVADWRELKRIRNPELLSKLHLRNNPLEREPDYRYLLLQHFPQLRVLDELVLPEGAAFAFRELHDTLSTGIVAWVANMVGLDRWLTAPNGHSDQHSTRKLDKAWLAQVTEQMRSLAEESERLSRASLLEKGSYIEKLVGTQFTTLQPLSEEHILRTEYSYFYQLILEISGQSDCLVDYLLEQVRLADESQEDLLKQSIHSSLHVLFLEFKALGCQLRQDKNHRLSSLETDTHTNRHSPSLPYLSTEVYFVDSTIKILVEILNDAMSSIGQYLTLLTSPADLQSRHQTHGRTHQQSASQPNEQTYRSEERDRQPMLAHEDANNSLYCQDEYCEAVALPSRKNVPTSLLMVLLNLLQSYQLKHAFVRIKKTNRRRFSQLRNFAVMFAIKETISQRAAFEAIKGNWEREERLELEYGRMRTLERVFGVWKKQHKAKARRLRLLGKIVSRKEKIENTVKHFAFVRWKILNSRTLRYIQSIRQLPLRECEPYQQRQLTERQILREYAELHRNKRGRAVTSRPQLRSVGQRYG